MAKFNPGKPENDSQDRETLDKFGLFKPNDKVGDLDPKAVEDLDPAAKAPEWFAKWTFTHTF